MVGLAAGRGWERLVEQARDHGVPAIALADSAAAAARGGTRGTARVLTGDEGVRS